MRNCSQSPTGVFRESVAIVLLQQTVTILVSNITRVPVLSIGGGGGAGESDAHSTLSAILILSLEEHTEDSGTASSETLSV